MTGEPENKRCDYCGGDVTFGMTTLPFVISGSVVIVKRVPAEICTQCGEAIMESDVAAVMDQLLKHVRRSGCELSIVTHAQLAPEPA